MKIDTSYKQIYSQIMSICPNAERADIEWLIASTLKVSRSALITIKSVTKMQMNKLFSGAKKLASGMPLSQIIGSVDFCDCTINVSRSVLTPRPETEELAWLAIQDILAKNKVGQKLSQEPNKKTEQKIAPLKVLDLCCGSGAIGIAIAKNTGASVVASDISKRALKVAAKNAEQNGVNAQFVHSDMLKNIVGKFDYILCNPPYIAKADPRVAQNVLDYEPHLALFAKNEGYRHYIYLANHVKDYLLGGGAIYMEVGAGMAQKVAQMFAEYKKIEIIKDISGIDRIVKVTR